jgi:methylmalonyl-CoA/ethylmalonyl-CoA epimerase
MIPGDTMSYPFEKLHHICIAVRDIEEKMRYFESIGIGPWTEYPPLAEYTEIDTPNYDGFISLRFVQAMIGDIELQLVQPSNEFDSPQKRFLDTCGEGVYHIGFVVDDANKGETVLKERGLEVISRGRRPDQSGFDYFDTKKEAGVTLLIRKSATHK